MFRSEFMNLKDKIILITGASRGIGFEIAKKFIENNAIVIAISRDEKTLNENKNELKNYIPYPLDITDSEGIKNLSTFLKENFEKVDVLINNAGITKDNFLIRMKEKDFDDVININLKGTFLMTKEISKFFKKQKYGNIINISSIVGIEGNSGQTNYSAAKAGIIGMTKTWAKELTLRNENIRVNAIAPGFIKTSMTENLSETVLEKVKEKCLIKRLGEAEDIANLALFLASDRSSYITGQIIRVDGGLSI
jgi:3-oxoacyl-[acyl-carrier protein] reductase